MDLLILLKTSWFQVLEQQFAVILFSFVEIIKPRNSCLANISAPLPGPRRAEARWESFDQMTVVTVMAELGWESNLNQSLYDTVCYGWGEWTHGGYTYNILYYTNAEKKVIWYVEKKDAAMWNTLETHNKRNPHLSTAQSI